MPGRWKKPRTALSTAKWAEHGRVRYRGARSHLLAPSREHRPAVGSVAGKPGRANTTEAAWLTGLTFRFHDENAAPQIERSAGRDRAAAALPL